MVPIGLTLRLNRSCSSSSSRCSFPSAIKCGLVPCTTSINQFLFFLATCRRYKFIAQFVPLLNHNQIAVDHPPLSYCAWALLKLGALEEAERIFGTLDAASSAFPKCNFWNSLVRAYCLKRKDPQKGYSVLQASWRFRGVVPSAFTLNLLIRSFSSQGKMREAVEVLELMNGDRLRYPLDNHSCASIICGYCEVGNPQLVFQFFENVVSIRGLKPNLVTYTAFLNVFFMLGRFPDGSNLSRRMDDEGVKVDAAFYGCGIYGYLRKGMLMEAFPRLKGMSNKGFSLNNSCYRMLTDCISKNWSVQKTYEFLDKMVKHGLLLNLVAFTSIIMGFCGRQPLHEAFKFFSLMKDLGIEMDEFVYDILIDGVCQAGDVSRTYELIEDMKSKTRSSDAVMYTILLFGYMKEGNRQGILNVKQRIEGSEVYIDIGLCNVLIRALFMVDQSDEATSLYGMMDKIGLDPDSVTFCYLINGFCEIGKITEALEVFNDSRKLSYQSSTCYSCLISGLCKNSMIDLASKLFVQLTLEGFVLDKKSFMKFVIDIMKEKGPDEVVYQLFRNHCNILKAYDSLIDWTIKLLCKRNFLIHACELLVIAKWNQLTPSPKSYNLVFERLPSNGSTMIALSCLSSLIKEFGMAEPSVMKVLMYYLCQKDFERALLIYDQMKADYPSITFPVDALKSLATNRRSLLAYGIIIRYQSELSLGFTDFQIFVDCLCKDGFLLEALELCEMAESCGISLSIATYNLVIHGLCLQGSLSEACRLFDALEKVGLFPSEMTYGIIIHSLCRGGYISDAKQYLEKLILNGSEPSKHIYNSFIYGYSKFNLLEDALQILNIMENKHIAPDEYSISALMDGYCRCGDMEGALILFLECKRKSMYPDLLGFLVLIRGLFYKGRMEEARSVLRNMLQHQPVTSLINQLCVKGTSDTPEDLLIPLCEQGMIWEAVDILTDIASILFPSDLHNQWQEPPKLFEPKEHSQVKRKWIQISEMNKVYIELSSQGGKLSQGCQYKSLYHQAADLYGQGNTAAANSLIKEMLSLIN